MVLSQKIKNGFSKFKFLVVSLVIFFIVINIAHLIWYYLRPEGFWSFLYFLRVLALTIGGLAYYTFVIGFCFLGVVHLFENFPNNFTWKKILKGVGIIIALIFIDIFNFFQLNYFELQFYDCLANKYKYLKVSEKYIAKRQYSLALESAKEAEAWASKDRTPLPFFLLTRLYLKTTDAQLLKADSEFSATINYAYCLNQFDSLRQESIHQYERALKISNLPLLANRPGYKIFPLSQLVSIYLDKGDQDKADRFNTQLFEHVQHVGTEDVEYFTQCQQAVANQALSVGDNKTAAALLILNHTLYQQAELDQKTAKYLNLTLGATLGYILQNDLLKAGQLLKEAEELAENRKNKEIYIFYLTVKAKYADAASVENRGYEELLNEGFFQSIYSFFTHQKTLSEKFRIMADGSYKELMEKTEERYGLYGTEHVNTLLTYANYLLIHRDFASALGIFQRLLKVKEVVKDPNLTNQIELRSMVSQSLMGKPTANLIVLKQIEDQVYKDASDRLPFLAENERETYSAKIHQDIQLVNTLLLNSNNPERSAQLFNNVLASKNLTLYTNQYLRSVLLDSTNHRLKGAYLTLLRQKDNTRSRGLDMLIREKQLIARIRKLPGYKSYNPRQIGWQTIRSALKSGTSAVEYIAAPDLAFPRKTLTYYALIVTPTSQIPTVVRLCSEESLTRLLNRGGSLKQSTDSIYTQSLPQLKSLLVEPVIKATGPGTRIYLSLTGRLHQLSFPALLEGSGRDFEILGSTRLLADTTTAVSLRKQAILFGNIDYGTPVSTGNIHDTNKRSGFSSLAFTDQETKDIQSLLALRHYSPKLVSGKLATEQAFRNISGQGNAIVHLATHGTYDRLPVREVGTSTNQLNLFVGETPMSQCRLIFAGANLLADSPANKEADGMVTAQDISRFDLHETDLVVLSACESGLGKLTSFEGVQGFQRAFTLAGARYTLVSLWNVSDRHTAELMHYFYSNLLAGDKYSIALLKAQTKMKDLYKSPYYWAGFVLIRG